jgi:predicted permease
MGLLQAMLETVLPVFILAGLGFMARRVLKVEVKDRRESPCTCLRRG